MTRISSLAVDYYHAAKKKKMRTAATSGLVVAAVIMGFALTNGPDRAANTALESGAHGAAGRPATVATVAADSMGVTSDGGGGATSSRQAGAKSPPGDLRGAIRTERAEDFDPDAAGEDHEGEYPDGVVVAEDDKERQHGDDYTDDVAGGLMAGGGGDDDAFLLDSPDGPPTDDMTDDGVAEEV